MKNLELLIINNLSLFDEYKEIEELTHYNFMTVKE